MKSADYEKAVRRAVDPDQAFRTLIRDTERLALACTKLGDIDLGDRDDIDLGSLIEQIEDELTERRDACARLYADLVTKRRDVPTPPEPAPKPTPETRKEVWLVEDRPDGSAVWRRLGTYAEFKAKRGVE